MKYGSGNIFVGISLGNKSLNAELVHDIERIAFEDMKASRVCYLIADQLDLINHRVFGRYSDRVAKKKIKIKMEKYESIVKGATSSKYSSSVRIAHWDEVLNRNYWRIYFYLHNLYINENIFRSKVVCIAEKYAARRGRFLNYHELEYLGNYIIGELPTLICGISVAGRNYRRMIYPAYVGESVENLANEFLSGEYGKVPFFNGIEIRALELPE